MALSPRGQDADHLLPWGMRAGDCCVVWSEDTASCPPMQAENEAGCVAG